MDESYELVPFRFLSCPACKHQICWVNPRLPNFCPECGKGPHDWRERVFMRDDEAILMTHNAPLAGGEYVSSFKGD